MQSNNGEMRGAEILERQERKLDQCSCEHGVARKIRANILVLSLPVASSAPDL